MKRIAVMVACLFAVRAARADAPAVPSTDAERKTAMKLVEVYDNVATVVVDNQDDCARMSRVLGLVFEANKDAISRAQKLVADGRWPTEVGYRAYASASRMNTALTKKCAADASVATALQRFVANTSDDRPGLDDAMMKRFVVVFDKVTNAVASNAPDCKKITVAVNSILDANQDLLVVMRKNWSTRNSAAIADRVLDMQRRVAPAMRACDSDKAMHAALRRFGSY